MSEFRDDLKYLLNSASKENEIPDDIIAGYLIDGIKAIRKAHSVPIESIPMESPINIWFSLSYAQFLTVPRVVLESMPIEWQRKMAKLLGEMDDTFDWRPKEGRYWVRLRDSKGKFSAPELCDYRRGNIEHLRE